MRSDEGLDEELTTEKLKVVVDRKKQRLPMKILHGSRRMRPQSRPETLILLPLNSLDVSRLQVREKHRSGVIRHRSTENFVGDDQVFLIVAPLCTRKGFDDIQSGCKFANDPAGMRAKSKLRIEDHTQDRRVFHQRKKDAVQVDLGMMTILVRIRREESDT